MTQPEAPEAPATPPAASPIPEHGVVYQLTRHFSFVLGGLLVLIALGIAVVPNSAGGRACGSLLSSKNAGGPCDDRHTKLLVVVAAILLLAIIIAGTYAVFLFFERRQFRHAVREAIEVPPDASAQSQSILVTSVTDRVHSLVALHPEISVVALVGSRARGTATDDSDVDLIVLAPDPTSLLNSGDWYHLFGVDAQLIGTQQHGAITERRLKLSTGLELDVGIGALEWLGTDPMDPGTARVLTDGAVPIYDPQLLLNAALRSMRKG